MTCGSARQSSPPWPSTIEGKGNVASQKPLWPGMLVSESMDRFLMVSGLGARPRPGRSSKGFHWPFLGQGTSVKRMGQDFISPPRTSTTFRFGVAMVQWRWRRE